jgi:3-phosphoshikimate 1-carboxyvinyltransferase
MRAAFGLSMAKMALPDLIEIVPLDKPVRAEITVPGSKSITNRALILAALAEGEVTLKGALWSEDTQIMVECLKELGFVVHVAPDPDEPCNRTILVMGEGGLVPAGGTETEPLDLFVGNAGTAARFLAPFLCLGSGIYRLHGVPRMHERPQAALFRALRELGYRIESEFENDKLPARIFAGTAGRPPDSMTEFLARKSAPAVPKKCRVSIEESSQFASALLLSAKAGRWEIEVVGENAEESPYVAMTSKLMEVFPKNGGTFQIEPDASSGSYFWGAGVLENVQPTALPENYQSGETYWQLIVQVSNWPVSGWQVDQGFPSHMVSFAFRSPHYGGPVFHDITTQFGADWMKKPEVVVAVKESFEPLCVSRKTDLGDSVMTSVTLAPLSFGISTFTDIGRLRVQECERVVALRTELTKCGAKVVEEGDTLTVYPSELHGAEIETYNDHRMAMCFAILGLKVPGIRIKNPACVKKTFPNFFQKVAGAPPNGLGAEIWEVQADRRTRKLSGQDLFAD